MTIAVAVTVVSLTEVAVIVTELPVVGTVPGAVYLPVLASIVPSQLGVVVAQVLVGTDHVTAVQSVVPTVLTHPGLLTLAVKIKFSAVPTVAVVGAIKMAMPERIVTVAVAVLVVSAWAVAVIVAVGVIVGVPPVVLLTVGTVLGAV